MKKTKHPLCFVVGGARFLCFIFPKKREERRRDRADPNGLIIIDKVIQGGIIG
jgi:hypothetical protein